jgi:hypothetical protein
MADGQFRTALAVGVPTGLLLGFLLAPDPTGVASLLLGVVLAIVLSVGIHVSDWTPGT